MTTPELRELIAKALPTILAKERGHGVYVPGDPASAKQILNLAPLMLDVVEAAIPIIEAVRESERGDVLHDHNNTYRGDFSFPIDITVDEAKGLAKALSALAAAEGREA